MDAFSIEMFVTYIEYRRKYLRIFQKEIPDKKLKIRRIKKLLNCTFVCYKHHFVSNITCCQCLQEVIRLRLFLVLA